MPRKQKIRDKYWNEKDPKCDYDFIEVMVPEENLDQVIQDHGSRSYIEQLTQDPTVAERKDKKKHRLWAKIWKAAAKVLTDRQFQIYVERNILKKKEVDIAKALDVNQSYIANVLKVSNKKIRKALRLEEHT